MTSIRLAGSATACALLLASGNAMAETKAGADISVSGGVATNPYGASSNGDGKSSLTGNVQLAPTVSILSATGSTTLTGLLNHTEYARLYGSQTDYTVGATTNQRLGATTTLTGGANYSSQVRSALFPIVDPISGLPTNPNDPVLVDPSGAASYAQRTKIFSSNVGLSSSLSSRDSISVSGRFSSVAYPGSFVAGNSYNSYGGGLSYMRVVSARTSVGVGLNVGRNDYLHTPIGDSTQISPSLILNSKLSSRLTIDLSAGTTFSNADLGLLGKSKHTAFYGTGNLCYAGERSNLCATASRTVSPTGFIGTSITTSLAASYSYKLTPRSDINLAASYSRAQTLEQLNRQSFDYGTANATYNRQISRRLFAMAGATYSASFQSNNSSLGNVNSFYGYVGVRYKLGNF